MSRSGYSDDYGDEIPGCLWRQAVRRATTGYRGQHLLKRLRDALDAMPVKRLITGAIRDESGEVCALGALDPAAPNQDENDWDEGHARRLAKHFGIAEALAAEIVYMNDEFLAWRNNVKTPEERWIRMRKWVDEQILPESPQDVDAVDPVSRITTG